MDLTVLAPRERAVADLLLTGSSTAEVADELGIKPASVRATLHRVYRKLGMAGLDELRERHAAPVPDPEEEGAPPEILRPEREPALLDAVLAAFVVIAMVALDFGAISYLKGGGGADVVSLALPAGLLLGAWSSERIWSPRSGCPQRVPATLLAAGLIAATAPFVLSGLAHAAPAGARLALSIAFVASLMATSVAAVRLASPVLAGPRAHRLWALHVGAGTAAALILHELHLGRPLVLAVLAAGSAVCLALLHRRFRPMAPVVRRGPRPVSLAERAAALLRDSVGLGLTAALTATVAYLLASVSLGTIERGGLAEAMWLVPAFVGVAFLTLRLSLARSVPVPLALALAALCALLGHVCLSPAAALLAVLLCALLSSPTLIPRIARPPVGARTPLTLSLLVSCAVAACLALGRAIPHDAAFLGPGGYLLTGSAASTAILGGLFILSAGSAALFLRGCRHLLAERSAAAISEGAPVGVQSRFESYLAYRGLSPVEISVAALSVQGLTTAQIAHELTYAVSTVKAVRGRAYRRLGIRSLEELSDLFQQVIDV